MSKPTTTTATTGGSSAAAAAAAGCPVAHTAQSVPSGSACPVAAAPGESFSISSSFARCERAWRCANASASKRTLSAKLFWNEKIAHPTNNAARVANVEFQKVRQSYPGPLIIGATASVFLLSAVSGRGSFRTVRNTSFAALFSGLAIAPSATIGVMALTRDRIAAAAGYNRPTTVVVVAPTPAVSAPVVAKKQ